MKVWTRKNGVNLKNIFQGSLCEEEIIKQGDKKKHCLESAANVRDKNIIYKDIIRDIFK